MNVSMENMKGELNAHLRIDKNVKHGRNSA